MANRENRGPGNADGAYYVDTQCIACNACVDEAPEIFAMNHQKGCAFVQNQPLAAEQTRAALAAMRICPVNCIGNDQP